MTAFLSYLLEVIVCSALFAGCYWWILRNSRSYQWNRFYIVVSVMLSIIFPLVDIPVSMSYIAMPTATNDIAHVVMAPVEVTNVPVTSGIPSLPWPWLACVACMVVTFLLLVKETISFTRIIRLKHQSDKIFTPDADLYCTDDETAPFTFFRSIFWKKGIPVDSGEGRCMLRHELAHVRFGHSWDKALMQLACCMFWMNPFFMLLRRELELVHEFAADSESIGEGNAGELSSLILCTLYPNHYHDFTSHFFQSSIKRRIAMITNIKKPPMGLLRKLSVVPVILIALYAFSVKAVVPSPVQAGESESISSGPVAVSPWTSQNALEDGITAAAFTKKTDLSNVAVPVNSEPERKIKPAHVVDENDAEASATQSSVQQDDEIFTIVENMPKFNGKYAEVGFRDYVSKNTKYPAEALEKKISGKIIVEFIIDQQGNLTDAKIMRPIDPLLDAEALRVVKSSPKWTPGTQRGKVVKVKYFFPVTFKFNDDKPPVTSGEKEGEKLIIVEDKPPVTSTAKKDENTSQRKIAPIDKGDIFTIVENMPKFNGKVAEEGFREYVNANMVYPTEAQNNGISGKVILEFTIDEQGDLTDAKVMRPIDPLLDAEALRVVKTSPKWTPGTQRGQTVKVKYFFPVTFKLNK